MNKIKVSSPEKAFVKEYMQQGTCYQGIVEK